MVLFWLMGTITLCGQGTVLLTQQMLDNAGASFEVKKNYSAKGAVLQLPKNMRLVFDGGKIDNAELVGNQSYIQVKGTKPVFGKNVIISGTWNVKEAHDGWFEFEKGKSFVANQLIRNMLAFSDDDTFCHLYFEEDRVYYFELPYKGNAKLGDVFTYHINKDGKKKRHYMEMYHEEYSFLRIFTIPSNTWVTINNTLQMLPTNVGAYFVFWEYGKENITIDGKGTVAGDNKEHLYTSPYAGKYYFGEYGFVFRCFKCRNFTIRNITIRDAFGDCFIYQGSYLASEQGSRYAEGLLMENVKIIGARRNGVAIGARNVVIRNCHFENCGIKAVKGTPPRCAIDFEPDGKKYPEIGNQNVLMENCTFKNNYFDVGSYLNNTENYGKIATTVKNCKFTAPLKTQGTYWMRFENCYIPFLWNNKDSLSVLRYSKNMEFVKCEFGQLDVIPSNNNKSNNTFKKCKYNTAVKKD